MICLLSLVIGTIHLSDFFIFTVSYFLALSWHHCQRRERERRCAVKKVGVCLCGVETKRKNTKIIRCVLSLKQIFISKSRCEIVRINYLNAPHGPSPRTHIGSRKTHSDISQVQNSRRLPTDKGKG